MIFSSIEYLVFLPIVVFLYWRTSGWKRLGLVVAASYYFYMSWFPIYGILLAVMTTLNWCLGLALGSDRAREEKGLAKTLFIAGLFLNLGCLFYYKYTNFVIQNICSALNIAVGTVGGAPLHTPVCDILLPLGISFFVFEFVHYLVDVYKGDKPIQSWMEFAAFAAFFPSQIAGPIKRFQDFVVWLRQPLPFTKALFLEAMELIIRGLFKKVAIADPLGALTASSYAANHVLSAGDAWIASIGFVVQIYCDFSGYTDMGRGSALLLGIRLPENFKTPYLAHDLADFWRRWHMSLGAWLRDYVYYPLGGSRRNWFSNWRALFLVMLTCGVWHGADWHYVIFGALHGLGLIVHRVWRNFISRTQALQVVKNSSMAKWGGTLLTMLFVTATFTLFRAPDLTQTYYVLAGWFNLQGECTLWQPLVKSGVMQIATVYMAVWLATIAFEKYRPSPKPMFLRFPAPVQAAAWTAAVILLIAAKPNESTPFVYFQF